MSTTGDHTLTLRKGFCTTDFVLITIACHTLAVEDINNCHVKWLQQILVYQKLFNERHNEPAWDYEDVSPFVNVSHCLKRH